MKEKKSVLQNKGSGSVLAADKQMDQRELKTEKQEQLDF